MIFNFFKDKSKHQDDRSRLLPERGPLEVSLGGALDMDFLSLEGEFAGQETAMPIPKSGPFIVTGYGEVRLDENTVLSRYYDDEHRIVQVMSEGEGGDAVRDISFYMPWDTVVPAGAGEWDRWTGHDGLIGQPAYDADGIIFERFWSSGPERAEPVQFVETVDTSRSVRQIHQTCMLYSRNLGAGREMLLISVEREIGETQRRAGGSIEFLVGYGMAPADVRRV